MDSYLDRAEVNFASRSETNQGVARPANQLSARASGDYILYFNDDIYVAPGWDTALLRKVDDTIPYQYITACMFEPKYNNACMNSPSPQFGEDPRTFNRKLFDDTWMDARRITNDIVSPWGPIFIKRKVWERIGGFDEGYYPGFGTDPDFVAELYAMAVEDNARYEFRGVCDSGMFHFQCVTTDKLPQHYREEARFRFLSKWGKSPAEFHTEIGAGKGI
jgi:GT2 family glycosyltransferase